MHGGTREAPIAAFLHVQAQVFEVVAGDDVLTGFPADLARRFGTTPDGFLACLDGLVRAGWVTVSTEPGGLCRIRLEP